MEESTLKLEKNGKRKRGMKPRSKRNRKRARGGVGILLDHDGQDDDNSGKNMESHVQVDILPLELLPSSTMEDDSNNAENKEKQNEEQKDETNSAGNARQKNDGMNKKRVRVVRPYPFTFATFAKARWIGRSVLDVYNDEYGSYPKSYYESAIKQGRILVDRKRVDCSHKIKDGSELCHVVHRHEPAVALCDIDDKMASNTSSTSSHIDLKPYIKVIHEDDSIIVVDKPSTVPVHPCGGYNFNSLFHILQDQDKSLEGKLHNVHRLDRLTSGLTIIAKNTETAKSLTKCITDRDNCHKVYLARVKGAFPSKAPVDKMYKVQQEATTKTGSNIIPCINGEWNPALREKDDSNSTEANPQLFWFTNDKDEVQASATLNDIFTARIDPSIIDTHGNAKNAIWLNLACSCEIKCHKIGVCEAGTETGKTAQTSFAVISYDEESDSTIVLARPQTGRMHQIRLHLQYLGHPICNDPNYGGSLYYGNQDGLDNFKKASRMIDCMDKADATDSIGASNEQTSCKLVSDVPATEEEVRMLKDHERREDESLLDYIQRSCVWCARSKREDRPVLEFLVRSQGIMLHAFQYSMMVSSDKTICYRTTIPDWARSTNDTSH